MIKKPNKTKKHLFPLSYYDKNFHLKVNFLSIIVMFICCKSIYITVAALVADKGANTLIKLFFFNEIAMAASFIAAVPALVVLITWSKRHSGASQFIRTVWQYGKVLLITSVLTNIAIDIYSLTGRPRPQGVDFFLLCMDGGCLLYIFRSKVFTAVFQDFPEPLPE